MVCPHFQCANIGTGWSNTPGGFCSSDLGANECKYSLSGNKNWLAQKMCTKSDTNRRQSHSNRLIKRVKQLFSAFAARIRKTRTAMTMTSAKKRRRRLSMLYNVVVCPDLLFFAYFMFPIVVCKHTLWARHIKEEDHSSVSSWISTKQKQWTRGREHNRAFRDS